MEIELLVYYFLFLFLGAGLSAFLNGYLNNTFNLNKMYDPVVERSSHKDKATRSGGLALFLTFCICYGIGKALGVMSVNLYALIAFCFVALIGVGDDLFTIKYREKFFVQVFAGVVLLQSRIYINNFHGVFGIYEIPYWASAVITIYVFVVIVNSLNQLMELMAGRFALYKVFCYCWGYSCCFFKRNGACCSVNNRSFNWFFNLQHEPSQEGFSR